jgi:transposase-like protein
MENEQEKPTQRWTAKRRAALVVEILRGDTSAQEAARLHSLTVAEIDQWKERFLAGAENALRSRPLDEEEVKDREIKRLKQKIGDLVMDIDILKEAQRGRPTLRQMPEE